LQKHKQLSYFVETNNTNQQKQKLMQTKGKRISFKGQEIYVGIDTHLKSWKVTIMTANLVHKTFSQDPNPEILYTYLKRNFPEGNYNSAYEASFCGFWIHRSLLSLGVNNIVVNPADIPTTDKEKKQKEDMRDSRKLAKALRSGLLHGIHIPSKETEELQSLVRYRRTLVKDILRTKSRIRSNLYKNGVEIPDSLSGPSRYWSNKFTQWIEEIKLTTSFGTFVLQELLDTMLLLRKKLLLVNRKIREASQNDEYKELYGLLIGIPGVGTVTAISLIAELGDINRFKNLNHLCSYVGLVPTTNSSGEQEKIGRVTPRANKFLRRVLIESSWVAIRNDPALTLAYSKLCERMKPNEAIIRIAKKLLNRIRFVMKNKTTYVSSIVS